METYICFMCLLIKTEIKYETNITLTRIKGVSN